MKKLLALIVICAAAAFAGVNVGTMWEIQQNATASNVNAGLFDPGATAVITDVTCATPNTSTPGCSSASLYTFVTTPDANAWLYIQSGGSGWTAKLFCKISSVTTGVATLDAALGNCVIQDTATLQWRPTKASDPNSGVGVANTASPTGNATVLIDYSQTTAAPWANVTVGCASSGSAITYTSTTALINLVGNGINLTTATDANHTIGRYEITAVTPGSPNSYTVTTNAAATNACLGSGSPSGAYIGGAISLGGSTTNNTDNTVFSQPRPGNILWIKYSASAYSLPVAITTAASGTNALRVLYNGYNSIRGDAPIGASRPTITFSANALSFSSPGYANLSNLVFTVPATSTANGVLDITIASIGNNLKVVNPSTATSKYAVSITSGCEFLGSEAISYRGMAISVNTSSTASVNESYIHGSDYCIAVSATGHFSLSDSIVEDCGTAAILLSANTSYRTAIHHSTIANGASVHFGIGLSVPSGGNMAIVRNSIFTGFTSPVSAADTTLVQESDYNDYYGNTNPPTAANWQTGPHDLAVNPQFSGVSQITTANGASVGSSTTFTDAGNPFTGIVANQDELYLISAGSGTCTSTHYLITTVTNSGSLVLSSSPCSVSGTSITYSIITGHNYATGNNLRAQGWPGSFPVGYTSSLLNIGAAQNSVVAAGGGGAYVQ